MIPAAFIQAWRAEAPWPELRQVEQDLIICRALCDLFNAPRLTGKLAFRGGTAIHKLVLRQALRYSEDIDLVQTQAEPIGDTVNAIRSALFWLGDCQRERADHSMRLVFRFKPESAEGAMLKLKIEINTREHRSFFGTRSYRFSVDNPWYDGQADLLSFTADELFGTKLRALLQRRKSRDLFDLYHALDQSLVDPGQVVACFEHYLECSKSPMSRAMAEERMLKKLTHSLTEDIAPLLPTGVSFTEDHAINAFNQVWTLLIARIRGDAWKSSPSALQELRSKKHPNLIVGS